MSLTNMKSVTISGQTVTFGYIPIVLDPERTIPYLQYALIKNPAGSTMAPRLTGASLPAVVTNESSGPVFTLVFTPILSTGASISVTASEFQKMLKPTLKFLSPGVSPITLSWDNEDSDYSLWTTPTASRQLVSGTQYMVSTIPVPAATFNSIPSGMVYLSLEPTTTSPFAGTELGILGVRYRLKLNPSVT